MNFKKLTHKLFCQSTALLCAAGSEHALAKSRQRIKPRKTCYSAQEFQDFPLLLWGAQICTTAPRVWCSDWTEIDTTPGFSSDYSLLQIISCVSSEPAAFPIAKKDWTEPVLKQRKGLYKPLTTVCPQRRSSADPERFPPALRTQLYFRAQAEHTLSLMALNKPG